MRERIRRRLGRAAGLFAAILILALAAGCSAGAAGEPKAAETQAAVTETERAKPETQAEAPATVAETKQAKSEKEPEAQSTLAETERAKPETKAKESAELSVTEDGVYTSKEEVALYLHTYGKLPGNYITKKEAEELGWKKKEGAAGQLQNVAPGKSIGGSRFGNYEGQLPEKKGRKYYECDIDYVSGNRGAKRIIYSNDGLIFYTGDHYETFEQLYPKEDED